MRSNNFITNSKRFRLNEVHIQSHFFFFLPFVYFLLAISDYDLCVSPSNALDTIPQEGHRQVLCFLHMVTDTQPLLYSMTDS